MICPNCGTQLSDADVFCTNCGTSVRHAASVTRAYSRGCFGSAWDDVCKSSGWMGKVALMALIDLVLILNFVNIGYGYRWGSNLARGFAEPLPKKIVSGSNFGAGFNVVVIGIVAAVILSLEYALLSMLPLIGLLAILVINVFAQMFLNLAYIRAVLCGRIGAGFEVGIIFDGFKRNLGTLFCVTVLPGVIAALLGALATLAVGGVVGILLGVNGSLLASGIGSYGSYSAWYQIDSFIASYGAAVVLLALVASYPAVYIQRFCSLVSQRAVGYYVMRFVPEWASGLPVGSGIDTQTQPAPSAPSPTAGFNDGVQREQGYPWVSGAMPGSEPVPAPPLQSTAPDDSHSQTAAPETSVLEEPETYDTVVQPEDGLQSATPEAIATPLSGGDGGTTTHLTMGAFAAADDAKTTAFVDGSSEARLTITRSNGESCTLTAYPAIIGKGTEANLRIEGNSAISRTHVRILRDGSVFAAEDLDATNKTFIGSYELAPYTPTILSDGDDLVLGNEVLHVTIA